MGVNINYALFFPYSYLIFIYYERYSLLLLLLIHGVVLAMILKDNFINNSILVPTDWGGKWFQLIIILILFNIYLIIFFVPRLVISFYNNLGETDYSHKMLLRLVLKNVFKGGLSSCEIERRTKKTDILHMYLGGIGKPKFQNSFFDFIRYYNTFFLQNCFKIMLI